MHIFFTRPTNNLDGNPIVKGLTIIRYVLICSTDTLHFLSSSLMTKYFNYICLTPLKYLSLLGKKATVKLSQ